MHYKNGREAKVGDRVLTVDSGGWASLGIVTKLYECSESCNLLIVPLRNQVCVTAKESLHVDDAFATAQPVTSPEPTPGASPAQLASPEAPVLDGTSPTVVQTVCPDCGNDDGTHTKGCAQYR